MAGDVRKSRLSREVPGPLTDYRDFRGEMAKKVQEVRTELIGPQSRGSRPDQRCWPL